MAPMEFFSIASIKSWHQPYQMERQYYSWYKFQSLTFMTIIKDDFLELQNQVLHVFICIACTCKYNV